MVSGVVDVVGVVVVSVGVGVVVVGEVVVGVVVGLVTGVRVGDVGHCTVVVAVV